MTPSEQHPYLLPCRRENGRMEDWRTGHTTRMAAALAALGVPIRSERVYRLRTNEDAVIYSHAPRSLDPRRAGMPTARALLHSYRSGELLREDPRHPLLDAIRVTRAYDRLRAWRDHGASHACVLQVDPAAPAGPGVTGRAVLELGQPVTVPAAVPRLRTPSLYRAAALACLGHIPVAMAESHVDVIDVSAMSTTRAVDLLRHPQDDTQPLGLMLAAMRLWQQLIAHVDEEVTQLMYQARRGTRSAFVLDRPDQLRKAERWIV